MKVEDIPQELIDILDKSAGKKHSRNGHVIRSLGVILTRYDLMRVKGIMYSMEHEEDCDPADVKEDWSCDNFCWGCCKCEPCRDGDFLVCGECLHIFRTAQELLDLHNEILNRLHYSPRESWNIVASSNSIEPLRLETDPTKVFSCPVCNHDF